MTTSDLLQLIATLIACFGLFYAGWQIRLLKKTHADNHEWNRRREAQLAIERLGELTPVTVEMHNLFDTANSKQSIPIERILAAIREDKDVQIKIQQVLNAYEALARGIHEQIYDESVVKSARRGAMIREFEAYSGYIKYRRTFGPNAYTELESLVDRWRSQKTARNYRDATG